jgi:hypothetical protein
MGLGCLGCLVEVEAGFFFAQAEVPVLLLSLQAGVPMILFFPQAGVPMILFFPQAGVPVLLSMGPLFLAMFITSFHFFVKTHFPCHSKIQLSGVNCCVKVFKDKKQYG